MNLFDLPGPVFLTFYGLLLAGAVVVALVLRRWLRQPSDEPAELPVLSPYEAAYLTGGDELAVNAALTRLVDEGILDVDAGQRKLTVRAGMAAPADPLEMAILQATKGNEGQPIKDVRAATMAELSRLRNRLLELGLLVSDDQACFARFLPAITVLCLVPIALVKINVGVEREKPVALLVIACIITAAIALFGFGRRVHRSRRGDLVLQNLREEHAALQTTAQHQALAGIDLALAVALFDLAILAGGPHANLQTALKPPQGASCAAGGCGGGCGGGGCGGGCGGCGGCGG
jgi:uncharacterized protein (TIGR04222 family)